MKSNRKILAIILTLLVAVNSSSWGGVPVLHAEEVPEEVNIDSEEPKEDEVNSESELTDGESQESTVEEQREYQEAESANLENEVVKITNVVGASASRSRADSLAGQYNQRVDIVDNGDGNITAELEAVLNDSQYQNLNASQRTLVSIPAGNFTINDSTRLRLWSYMTIVAEDATTITWASSTGSNSMIRVNPNDNYILQDGHIIGGTWNGNGKAKHIFDMCTATNSSVENVSVSGSPGNGIYFQNGTNITIKNATVSKCKNGVQFLKGSGVVFDNVSVMENNNNGIQFVGVPASTNRFENVKSNNNANSGIYCGAPNGTFNVTLSNITAKNNKGGNGIYFPNAMNSVVKNAISQGNYGSGLSAAGGQLQIIGGTYDSNSNYGFNLDGITLTVSGKVSTSSNGLNGIRATDGTKGQLSDLSSKNNGGHGLFVSNKSNLKITNSNFENNKEYGVQVSDQGVAGLYDVKVNSNKENGLSVSGGTCSVYGGEYSKNGENGISYSSNSTGLISYNSGASTTVSENKNYGLSVSGGSKLSEVSGIVVQKSNWSGASITNKNTEVKNINNASFTQNGLNPKKTADGAVGHGMGVSEGAYAEIQKSTFSQNKECGLSVFDGGSVKLTSCNINQNERHGIGARKNTTIKLYGTNKVNNNKYNGILASNKTTVEMKKTTVQSSGNIGVSIVDGSKVTMENSTVTGSKKSNISLTKGSDKINGASVVLKKNNVISNSKDEHGIVAAAKAKVTVYNEEQGNKITGNKKNGISLSDKSTLTLDNSKAKKQSATKVEKNGQNGIYVKGATATIYNAQLNSNKKYGLGVEGQANVSCSKTKIYKNKKYGFNVSGSGTKVKAFKKNTVEANNGLGVMITNKAVVSVFSNNKISKNKSGGMTVKAGARVDKAKGNSFVGHNKNALSIYSATVKKVTENKFSNPTANYEVYLENATSNISTQKPVTIGKVKSSSKKIKGSAPSKASVKVKVGKKTYKGKVSGKGNYSIKISKQPKKTKVEVIAIAQDKNEFSNTTVISK